MISCQLKTSWIIFNMDGVGGIESTKKDKKERREGVYLNKEKCF